MACDFRIATADAALGLPEIDVGLVTGIQGGLLIRLVGLQAAKELVYTGDPVSGAEAAELGLVNWAPPADEYETAIDDYVDTLAAKSPHILREQKRVFRAWRSAGIERGNRPQPREYRRLLRHPRPAGGDGGVPQGSRADVRGSVVAYHTH